MIDVIAVFDIGKTNKKLLLFNQQLNLVFQQEQNFTEIKDEEGFPCDDIDNIVNWMKNSVEHIAVAGEFNIKAINFATYGASLACIDKNGERITPVYNYLKPLPSTVTEGFFDPYGGIEEFSRKTASPPSGMLNAGFQILWLRKEKPKTFERIMAVLFLPQYLSYCFIGKIVTEFTYLGCHTSLWDFDAMKYHQWVYDYKLSLPMPEQSKTSFPVVINKKTVEIGVGIHDSSSSLVPYLASYQDQFVLISTGTWCIFMNPFNAEPLTTEQLNNNALCYLSVQQKPVKSSRLFLGQIHHDNVAEIAKFFDVKVDFYKNIIADTNLLLNILNSDKVFFQKGVPEKYVDNVDLERFGSVTEAYHQLMVDLVRLAMLSYQLVIPQQDDVKSVFISGGFARNELFIGLIATLLPDKKVYTTQIDNATALGAAMIIWEKAFGEKSPLANLGLNEVHSF